MVEIYLYLILYAIYFTFINQLLVPDSSIPILSEQNHFRMGTDGGTHHMPPLLSVLLSVASRRA
jgi:hypothetical protein